MLKRRMLMGLELTVNDSLLPEVELVKENGLQQLKLTVWKVKYVYAFCTERFLGVNSKILLGDEFQVAGHQGDYTNLFHL